MENEIIKQINAMEGNGVREERDDERAKRIDKMEQS
jgi:hypothetical protein